MRRGQLAFLSLVALAACAPGAAPPSSATVAPPRAEPPVVAVPDAAPGEGVPSQADAGTAPGAAAPLATALDGAAADDVLFADEAPEPRREACRAGPAADRVRCLLGARYRDDERSRRLALGLFEKTGAVVGVGRAEMFDGGWRGTIQLVPELPTGAHGPHLDRIARGLEDIDAFFVALTPVAPAPVRYRWRDLAVRVFRSVGRTTPSAYATGWTLAYNVAGSLNGTADAVRETLFHEIFHMNDDAHGDFSARALEPIRAAILARCGARTACLRPYAPGETQVRGGTYYAFQPGNPVGEYGAELAVRYYREQRAALGLGGAKAGAAWKCATPENERAWALVRDEFFGGADRTGACASAPR